MRTMSSQDQEVYNFMRLLMTLGVRSAREKMSPYSWMTAAFKEMYDGVAVQNLVYKSNPFLKMIKKDESV